MMHIRDEFNRLLRMKKRLAPRKPDVRRVFRTANRIEIRIDLSSPMLIHAAKVFVSCLVRVKAEIARTIAGERKKERFRTAVARTSNARARKRARAYARPSIAHARTIRRQLGAKTGNPSIARMRLREFDSQSAQALDIVIFDFAVFREPRSKRRTKDDRVIHKNLSNLGKAPRYRRTRQSWRAVPALFEKNKGPPTA